jgi:hypothetical protein
VRTIPQRSRGLLGCSAVECSLCEREVVATWVRSSHAGTSVPLGVGWGGVGCDGRREAEH